MASYVDIQGFEYPFAFVKFEVVSPSSQNRVQFLYRLEQGRSPGSEEDFLQLVSESLKAFVVDSGCPRYLSRYFKKFNEESFCLLLI